MKLSAVRNSAFALAATLALTLYANGPAQAKGRVALVLAGGGAAGAAHVGVIRSLEEQGVRPDCIAGTSIGAIVGGLYAIGLSVEQMEEVIEGIDWLAIFDDEANRELLHPARRESRNDLRSIFSTLPLGASADGVRTDAGLIDGNQLLLILRELTLPAAAVANFDDFPIPFRAVATDLASGEEVVMGEGDLALALRASMSLPGLFPPVVREGRVLVDGGVANNLPINVGRDLCASEEGDTVIAVNLPQAAPTPSTLTTFTGALGQTLALLISRSTDTQLETNRGFYELITPETSGVGTMDFAKVPETVEIGYQTTKADVARVAGVVARRSEFRTATRSLARRIGLADEIRVESVTIENDTNYSDDVIRAYLAIEPPTTITTEELGQRLERLYGLGAFDQVTYRLGPEDELIVVAAKREAGTVEFRLGAGFEDTFDGRSTYIIGGGVGFTQLDSLGRRIDVDGALGTSQLAAISIEQPLDYRQRWFLSAEANYSAFRAPLNTQPEERAGDYFFRRAIFGGDLGFAPYETLRVSVGPYFRWRRGELSTGDPGSLPANFESENAGARVGVQIDTLNDAALPTRGAAIDASILFEGEEALEAELAGTIEVDALAALPMTDRATVQAFVRGAGEIGTADEGIGFNRIGGFQRLSGFERDQFVGDVAGVVGARAIARSEFLEGIFGVAGFAGFSLEYGGAWDQWSDVGQDDGFVAGSIFSGLQTRLGPLYLAYAYGEAGNNAIYFGFGKSF